jgi:hypothetical protein
VGRKRQAEGPRPFVPASASPSPRTASAFGARVRDGFSRLRTKRPIFSCQRLRRATVTRFRGRLYRRLPLRNRAMSRVASRVSVKRAARHILDAGTLEHLPRSATPPSRSVPTFCNGGAPAFARVFDRRGKISTLDRLDDGSLPDFRQRARVEPQNLAGAARLAVRVLGRSAERWALAGFLGRRHPARHSIARIATRSGRTRLFGRWD